MAAALEYSAEQLNYYRICYVVTDILTEGLRTIFKQEWDNRYKTRLGEWKDDPKNGLDFWNGESPRNRHRNARLLRTMRTGDRADWDCTMLFYAILYSDCIRGLNPTVQSNVDDLRNFRNEEFAHIARGNLSKMEFQNSMLKVHNAFHALGLSTLKIQAIKNQTSFPTEELRDVLKKVDDLKQEVQEKEMKLHEKEKEVNEKEKKLREKGTKLQEKETELQEKDKELQEEKKQLQVHQDQLHSDVSPFFILPPIPSHDVATRTRQVAEITEQLKALKGTNDNRLSVLYISGNPGSGKSQLARLAAKRFYDEVKEIPSSTSFVMTLNAENPGTLLESFVSFARHCKCPEYAITNTLNSKELNTDEKITNLKNLISTKIEIYTSWLLVVDNVTSVSRVHVHLPDVGNEQWVRGQMLITTQDTVSIPLTSSSIQHISVSEGMNPDDARSLLTKLSGVPDGEIEEEVAKVLDYQPLALASAAIYVRHVRQNKATSKFGWIDYLKKLDKGQRRATETILAETNPIYHNSMTTAIALAAEEVVTSDKVIGHTLTFLSVCAPQPILQDIVIDYIMEIDEEFEDEDMISTRLSRCSLLLFTEEEESGVYIRVHGVVHNVINNLTKDYANDDHLKAILGAVTSFSQFLDEYYTENEHGQVIRRNIVPHLITLITKTEQLFSKQGISQILETGILTAIEYTGYFQRLGNMCLTHYEFFTAMKYFNAVLDLNNLGGLCSDEAVANAYGGLALVHIELDENEKAKYYYARALDIYLESLGPDHFEVAISYLNLGMLHRDLGDKEQSKDYLARALDIRLKNLGPDDVEVAAVYEQLGFAHNDLGNEEEAKDCFSRALDIRVKKPGSDHAEVALSYINLGVFHKELGDKEQAKDYYERALEIALKNPGPDHVIVATSYNNLGAIHSDLGDKGQAKDYYARALEICLKMLGPDHPEVAFCYSNLGAMHSELGDKEQAKDYYVRALDIRLEKLGPKHGDVADSYFELGDQHYDLGELEEAKECYERGSTIYLKQLGLECDNETDVQNKLDRLQQKMKRVERSPALPRKRPGDTCPYNLRRKRNRTKT